MSLPTKQTWAKMKPRHPTMAKHPPLQTPIVHKLTHHHPGELHNTYTGKRHTKDEMVEAHHIDAIKKAMKAEAAKRLAMESEDSVQHIAEYEEGLGQKNIDDTNNLKCALNLCHSRYFSG